MPSLKLPYIFIAPAVLYLVVLVAVPFAEGVRLGFTDTTLYDPLGGKSIGLENFREVVSDHAFRHSLTVTVIYTITSVAGALGFGLVAALAMATSFRGRGLVRSALVAPWAIPVVASTLIFAWMFNDSRGIFNTIAQAVGLTPKGWLTDPSWALASVTVATIWKLFPFAMLVLLAALQTVPAEMDEAARMDGADALNRFRYVTLPVITPAIGVITILMVIWSIRRFEIIWLLTGGGPGDTTNVLVTDVFREGFINGELGKSAAVGTIGLLLSVGATLTYLLVWRRPATVN